MLIRKSDDRGHFENSWLKTRYSFSFADYFDPGFMGFHDLRVINEDIVAPSGGFPTHGHQNMEIVSYIVKGSIAHKDSMGNVETLNAGEVQVMSAGRGVSHSEFNPSPTAALKLLQIWIKPGRTGIEPGYSQREFPRGEKLNRLCLLASPDGDDRSLRINQDAKIYASILEAGEALEAALAPSRAAWLQVIDGELTVNGHAIGAGDGLAVEDPAALDIRALKEAEFILFDLARRGP